MTKKQKGKAAILLHGINNPSLIMGRIGKALTNKGYTVLNIDYPSTKKPISELVEYVGERLRNFDPAQFEQIDFVGHSMGGIIIRELLNKEHRPENLGRVVMIGSPHAGSEVADRVKDWKLFKKLYGPAGGQLTTEFQKAASKGIVIDYPLGIIASDSNTGHFWIRSFIAGENDGLVSVESTKLNGMGEHIILPAPHVAMPLLPGVIKQVAHFLEHGEFDSDNKPQPKSKPKSQDPAPK